MENKIVIVFIFISWWKYKSGSSDFLGIFSTVSITLRCSPSPWWCGPSLFFSSKRCELMSIDSGAMASAFIPQFFPNVSSSPTTMMRGTKILTHRRCAPPCSSSTFVSPRLRSFSSPRYTRVRHSLHMRMFDDDPSSKDDSTSRSENPPNHRELSAEAKELRSVLKKCSLYLIGPMGSGKSSVGKHLAYELGFRFLDTDQIIENVANRSISEIFSTEGEEAFRDIETAVLDQVASFIGCCISTGGGIVIRKDNWGRLQSGIVVYLDVPVQVLHDRLMSETDNRPLLHDAVSLRDRITDIMFEREHLYKQADVTVHCKSGMPVDEITKEIIRSVTNFIKSNPPKLSTLYPGTLSK